MTWIRIAVFFARVLFYPLTKQFSIVLFEQLDKSLTDNSLNRFKRLILKLILENSGNGIIFEIRRIAIDYLLTNKRISESLFNTLLAISENKAKQQCSKTEYRLKGNNKGTLCEVRDRQLSQYIRKKNWKRKSTSRKEKIIRKYLINEDKYYITDLDINIYNIGILCYITSCGISLKESSFYNIIKRLIQKMIDIWHSNSNAYQLIDVYAYSEVINYLSRQLLTTGNVELVLDLLFVDIDFHKFKSKTFQFYEQILVCHVSYFFDSYKDVLLRKQLKELICKIEDRITALQNKRAKQELTKVLMLSVPEFIHADWNEFTTNFTIGDKNFLNNLWMKYGQDHVPGMLDIIYQFHIGELLPDILMGIRDCFQNAQTNMTQLKRDIEEKSIIINMIITKSFLSYNTQIKQDTSLCDAYENILIILLEAGIKEAAVLLDEFRIH